MSSIEERNAAIEQSLQQLPHQELGQVAGVFVQGWNRFETAIGEQSNPELQAVRDMLYEAGDHLNQAVTSLTEGEQHVREYMQNSAEVPAAVGRVAMEGEALTAEDTGPSVAEVREAYLAAYEALGQPTEADMDLARQILGEDFTYDPEAAYDDRRVILEEITQAREVLRERMRGVLAAGAEVTGIEVDEEAIAAWVPNDTECRSIAFLAKDAVRRYYKIQGVADFLADMEEDALESGVPLRPYQKVVVHDFYNFLVHGEPTSLEGGKAGIIKMPTGTGKTAIEAKVAAMILYSELLDDENVLVLTPRQKLADQIMGREGERGFGMFAQHLDVGEVWQKIHPLDREEQLQKKVVVMLTATFNNLMEQGRMPHFKNVLVDEVHTACQGTTGQNLREYIKDKDAVGLSATPEYSEDRSAYKLFPHDIYQMHLPDSIRFGNLAPTRGYLHDITPVIDYSQLPEDKSARRAAILAAYKEAWYLKAEQIAKAAIARGVGVAIRCSRGDDIDEAVKIAGRLKDKLVQAKGHVYGSRWIEADFVGGSSRRQTRRRRDEILEGYDRGEKDLVTYVNALELGWDSPHCKVHIDLSGGTVSKVKEEQGDGRALRLARDEKGDPIWAELHSFKNPFLGDKQVTCLDVLGLERSGDAVTHDPHPQPIAPRPRKHRRRVRAEVEGIIERGVEVKEVSHMVELAPMTQAELARITAQRKGDQVPFDEACRILGVNPPTLHNILNNLGTTARVGLRVEDLTSILDLYPALQAEPLPKDDSYVPALDVRDQVPGFVRSFTLLSFARNHGIVPHRFMDRGKVGFYFRRDQISRLVQLAEEREAA